MVPTRVLLTGAGGFVGGRVAHRIALGETEELTALLHTPAGPGAMRLARLPVDIEVGSVLDKELLERLLADCDAIVNCAFGMGKTSEDGTRTLLEAAAAADIESFVHLSSAVVHGHHLDGTLHESAPFAPDDEYGEWKRKGEEVIAAFEGGAAPDPAIIRPMIVYGPHDDWVTGALETVRTGAVLAEGGIGTLNQIYIDNLVDVILLAMREPAAKGETFLAVDDDHVTWRQFYRDVGSILAEHPPFQELSRREIRLRKRANTVRDSVVPPVKAVGGMVTADEAQENAVAELARTPWAVPLVKQVPQPVRERLLDRVIGDGSNGQPVKLERTNGSDKSRSPQYELPEERFVRMQSSLGSVSNEKSKDLLGWEQRVAYEKGMEYVGKWLAYDGRL